MKQGANAPAKILDAELPDVGGIEHNPSFIGIVEAAEELDQGALACAVRAHNRGNPAGGDEEAEIPQRATIAAWIMESHAIKTNTVLQRRGCLQGTRRINHLRLQG